MSYPILFGTMASQGGELDFELIQTIIRSSDEGAVDFSFPIPQRFKHLQIRLRSTSTGTLNTKYYMQINGNNSANDWSTLQSVTGTVSGTDNQQNGPAIYFGGTPGGSNLTYRQNSVIDIVDYSATNKYKAIGIHTGSVQGGTGSFTTSYTSALLGITDAITGISIGLASGGGNIKANSRISLYGIR
jgi:hypothetical protein